MNPLVADVQAFGLQGRDFLKESDFTAAEFTSLIELASALKSAKRAGSEPLLLSGKNIALIFEKSSTRTRCAFEVAAADQGANTTYLDPQSSQLGHKESVADTARVLSRFYDAIEFRGAAHALVEELAEHADVPVYNGLTDTWHPTQMLADFLTMAEHADGEDWADISYCYLGDARYNMGNSLLIAGALLGADVRIAAPAELQPTEAIQALATELATESGARITITDDPAKALAGAQFVHTDVWVSMGEPAEVWRDRTTVLGPYRVDANAMAATGRSDAKFMHCLPAYHDTHTVVGAQIAELTGMTDGIEVSDEVFSSTASIVWDQAENRLHTIKALLVATLA
ncbi:MAG: ornithine carbamoyltransferase [Candidatus Nanopelagicales bacterium]